MFFAVVLNCTCLLISANRGGLECRSKINALRFRVMLFHNSVETIWNISKLFFWLLETRKFGTYLDFEATSNVACPCPLFAEAEPKDGKDRQRMGVPCYFNSLGLSEMSIAISDSLATNIPHLEENTHLQVKWMITLTRFNPSSWGERSIFFTCSYVGRRWAGFSCVHLQS